ncbi:MAG: KpsF/GutQ family sugar-phosphate isomerase [Gammaproteobacteria bacterium]|nr:KpsF/GutQ family sugar-phosphate isomerase [Gammaproteobacteria bacterium]
MDSHNLKNLARSVIDTEATAVASLTSRIDDTFVAACQVILDCQGRIVVLGMGKSGHIAGKVAATMASTGTPAFFVHAAEASHGDLGMITNDDVVLVLSNSGETDEVRQILPLLKRLGVSIIAMTGKPASTLASHSDVHINVAVDSEACPLGLAPTSSTTAALVMGDALAVSLLESRGFTAEDYARSHPAGQLGKRLLLDIQDIMHTGDKMPLVSETASLSEAIVEMTKKCLGMVAIIDKEMKVQGVFTDGDLRRTFEQSFDPHQTVVCEVMTRNSKTISAQALAVEAVKMMQQYKVQGLLVVDDDSRLQGVLNFNDLLQAGVV